MRRTKCAARRKRILMHDMMIPEGVVIMLIGINVQMWGKNFAAIY